MRRSRACAVSQSRTEPLTSPGSGAIVPISATSIDSPSTVRSVVVCQSDDARVEVSVRRHQATCGPFSQAGTDERRNGTARIDGTRLTHHPNRYIDVPCRPAQRSKVRGQRREVVVGLRVGTSTPSQGCSRSTRARTGNPSTPSPERSDESATKTSPPRSTAEIAHASPAMPARVHTTSTSASQITINYLGIASQMVTVMNDSGALMSRVRVAKAGAGLACRPWQRFRCTPAGKRAGIGRTREVATVRAGIRGGLPARTMATAYKYRPEVCGGSGPSRDADEPLRLGPQTAPVPPDQESSQHVPYIPLG